MSWCADLKFWVAQAERGLSFELLHLDGRWITVTAAAGQLRPPVTSVILPGEGFPLFELPAVKGDLIVILTIELAQSVAGLDVAAELEVGQSPLLELADSPKRKVWQQRADRNDIVIDRPLSGVLCVLVVPGCNR